MTCAVVAVGGPSEVADVLVTTGNETSAVVATGVVGHVGDGEDDAGGNVGGGGVVERGRIVGKIDTGGLGLGSDTGWLALGIRLGCGGLGGDRVSSGVVVAPARDTDGLTFGARFPPALVVRTLLVGRTGACVVATGLGSITGSVDGDTSIAEPQLTRSISDAMPTQQGRKRQMFEFAVNCAPGRPYRVRCSCRINWCACIMYPESSLSKT